MSFMRLIYLKLKLSFIDKILDKITKIIDSPVRKLLSFAWLAWDVICVVRRANMFKCNNISPNFSFDPLSERITQHIQKYIEKRKSRPTSRTLFNYLSYKKMLEGCLSNNIQKMEIELWKMIRLYCDYNSGFFF